MCDKGLARLAALAIVREVRDLEPQAQLVLRIVAAQVLRVLAQIRMQHLDLIQMLVTHDVHPRGNRWDPPDAGGVFQARGGRRCRRHAHRRHAAALGARPCPKVVTGRNWPFWRGVTVVRWGAQIRRGCAPGWKSGSAGTLRRRGLAEQQPNCPQRRQPYGRCHPPQKLGATPDPLRWRTPFAIFR